jgi:ABC-2 type transport system permease protein
MGTQMKQIETFWGAFITTFHAIFTDKAVVSVMLGAVVLYSFFYPLGYQEQVAANQPIYIVDHDRSALSRELIRDIQSLRAVKVHALVIDSDEAVQAVRAMKIQGYVEIPADFEQSIWRGTPADIALFANGASLNTREGYGSFLVTGVAQLIIQQTLLIGLAVLAGTRRELYGRIYLTHKQIMGISAAAVSIGSVNMLYYLGFMFWYQDYPQHGSLGSVLTGSVLFISAVVAFGLFITSFFRTRERAFQLILVTALPLFFLANLSWPEVSSPTWLVWFAKIIPSTAGINMMVKITQYGAPLSAAKNEIINLLVLILVYGGLGWWRYHFYKITRQ